MESRTECDALRARRAAPVAGPLVAGAAWADITPEGSVFMAGFGFNRRSEGVRDPITVSCLYLDNGREAVALVSTDLVGLPRDDVEGARARIGPEMGPRTLIQATHNHEGPDTIGYWGWGVQGVFPLTSGRDPAYIGRVQDAIAECLARAMREARPARLRLAGSKAPAEITENIRRPGFKDDEISVLHVETPEGGAIGTFINWTCHPETLWSEYRYLSADYVGHLRLQAQRRLGGVAVYANGALGGMVTPRIEEGAPIEDRLALVESLGTRIGDLAADAVETSGAIYGPEGVEIALGREVVSLPLNNWRFKLARRLGILDRPSADWRRGVVATEANYLRIGPAEMVGVPGEALPSVGEAIKHALGAPYRFVLGLSGDEIGYILSEAEFADAKTYAYERTMSLGPRTWPILREKIEGLILRCRAPAARAS